MTVPKNELMSEALKSFQLEKEDPLNLLCLQGDLEPRPGCTGPSLAQLKKKSSLKKNSLIDLVTQRFYHVVPFFRGDRNRHLVLNNALTYLKEDPAARCSYWLRQIGRDNATKDDLPNWSCCDISGHDQTSKTNLEPATPGHLSDTQEPAEFAPETSGEEIAEEGVISISLDDCCQVKTPYVPVYCGQEYKQKSSDLKQWRCSNCPEETYGSIRSLMVHGSECEKIPDTSRAKTTDIDAKSCLYGCGYKARNRDLERHENAQHFICRSCGQIRVARKMHKAASSEPINPIEYFLGSRIDFQAPSADATIEKAFSNMSACLADSLLKLDNTSLLSLVRRSLEGRRNQDPAFASSELPCGGDKGGTPCGDTFVGDVQDRNVRKRVGSGSFLAPAALSLPDLLLPEPSDPKPTQAEGLHSLENDQNKRTVARDEGYPRLDRISTSVTTDTHPYSSVDDIPVAALSPRLDWTGVSAFAEEDAEHSSAATTTRSSGRCSPITTVSASTGLGSGTELSNRLKRQIDGLDTVENKKAKCSSHAAAWSLEDSYDDVMQNFDTAFYSNSSSNDHDFSPDDERTGNDRAKHLAVQLTHNPDAGAGEISANREATRNGSEVDDNVIGCSTSLLETPASTSKAPGEHSPLGKAQGLLQRPTTPGNERSTTPPTLLVNSRCNIEAQFTDVEFNTWPNRAGWRSVIPDPHSLSPPRALLVPEMLLHHVKTYLEKSCKIMTFDNNENLLPPTNAESSNALLSDFDSYCFTATMLIGSGRQVKFRRAISKATALIKQILLAEHPRTLSCFLEVFIHLIQTGFPSAASYFCGYIKAISKIIVRKDNSWGYICGLLGELESTSLSEVMAQVWKCITTVFDTNLGALNRFAVSVRLDYIKRVITDHLEEEHHLNNLLAQFQGIPTHATPRVMLNLAHNLDKQGRHHEAEKEAWEVWSLLQTHEMYDSRDVERIECLKIVSRSLFNRGQTHKAEAEETMREAIEMIMDKLGTNHSWVTEFKNVLESWLRAWDREEDADALQKEVETLIGEDGIDG